MPGSGCPAVSNCAVVCDDRVAGERCVACARAASVRMHVAERVTSPRPARPSQRKTDNPKLTTLRFTWYRKA